ncbi:MAG: hypothetical protein A3E82_01515 [Gammaproteobacteria bacterium RIFCSPHIGHO2_12_FULL_38_11]|nr:MAG: hypothetical protein A3E82_01515 [Gammaproteobacteria bacterium RIFCSPHIGHO2_12_FULL_38_11]
MNDEQFKLLEKVNYWQNPPKKLSYIRQSYLNLLIGYLGNNLVKVLVGQRRCGKSTILKQMISRLLEINTAKQNIFFLNFELHELQWIKTHEQLISAIEYYFQQLKPSGKVYIFLDEIQEIENWEVTVNSFLSNERYEIEFFLTGSNANLLSTELATYITGRYIELFIYPFSFSEYCGYFDIAVSRESLVTYIDSSGLPELFFLTERHQKISYVSALKDSVMMNDIVKRFQIKNPKLLLLLLDFLMDNTGKLFSFNAIAKKIKSEKISVNVVTLTNYIHYIELTFLIHSARRFDLRGKKILEGERKYYLNDLSFSNFLQNTFDNNVTRRLENFVYIALLQAGYQVYVGNIYQLEIDFIAEKNQQIIYLQVAYLLHSDDVILREYGNLEKIKDNWPKWVVSLDDFSFPFKNGIRHVQAWELEKALVALI